MKIALINLEQNFGCLPIGLAYIAGYVREFGGFNDIKVIDREDPIKTIKKYNPDIIGISVVSEQYYKAKNLAKRIKEFSNATLVIGGAHINAMPGNLKTSNFDIGVVGEGEQTFLELLNCFKNKKNPSEDELKKIKGIIFIDGKGKLIATPRRELIINLDSIPFPAYDLLKMKEFYLVPGPVGAGLIGIRGYLMTSRGCPYNCIYCGSNSIWGRSGTRWHSAERVVDDIKKWVEIYGTNHFSVYDDLMIVNKPRLRKIVDLLEKEGLTKKIDFELYGRANILDEEICRLLKRMNVTSIAFGLESGSERVLNYLKKGNVTVEQGKNAIKLCKKYGFKVTGLFILGSPGEKEEDMKKTIQFAKDPNLDNIQAYQATPLPGTELWATALKQKSIKEDFYEYPDRGNVLALNKEMVLSKEVTPDRFVELFKEFQGVMKLKNYLEDKPKFEIKMIKYFFYPRFFLKVWRRKGYIFNYAKQYVIGKAE